MTDDTGTTTTKIFAWCRSCDRWRANKCANIRARSQSLSTHSRISRRQSFKKRRFFGFWVIFCGDNDGQGANAMSIHSSRTAAADHNAFVSIPPTTFAWYLRTSMASPTNRRSRIEVSWSATLHTSQQCQCDDSLTTSFSARLLRI
jgi:hypothetical protein